MPGGYIRNYNSHRHARGRALARPGAHIRGGCNGAGDQVDDTPAELEPTSGCPAGKDTCVGGGLDPIHNYMDYSYDICYTEFTAGQSQRMQEQWLHWRLGRA